MLNFQKVLPGKAGLSDVILILILSFALFAALITILVNITDIVLPPSFLF